VPRQVNLNEKKDTEKKPHMGGTGSKGGVKKRKQYIVSKKNPDIFKIDG